MVSIFVSIHPIYILAVLLGALIFLTGIRNPSKQRTIIRYEIPILLLLPLADYVIAKCFETSVVSCIYTSPWSIVLAALCTSASALLPGKKSLIFSAIGTLQILVKNIIYISTLFSAGLGIGMIWPNLPLPAYLLFLCVFGFILDMRAASETEHPAFTKAEAASDTEDIPTTAPDKKERIVNQMDQKFKPGPAIRRAIIGAAIGAAAMAILFIAIGGNLSNILYGIFCGSLYGFGFAFADTQKYKKGSCGRHSRLWHWHAHIPHNRQQEMGDVRLSLLYIPYNFRPYAGLDPRYLVRYSSYPG